ARVRNQRCIIAPASLAIAAEVLGTERDGIRLRARALAQQQRCGLAAQDLAIKRRAGGHAAPVEGSVYRIAIAQAAAQFYRFIDDAGVPRSAAVCGACTRTWLSRAPRDVPTQLGAPRPQRATRRASLCRRCGRFLT